MDQKKIGKFICKMRKQNNLTQLELANKLGVTDRAISHWENGRRMPDISIIQALCKVLGITINDLLSGEIIDEEHTKEKFEENILSTLKYLEKKTKEQFKNKRISIIAFTLLFIIGIFFSYNEFFSYSTEYLNKKDSEIVQIEYDLNLEDVNWRYTKYEKNALFNKKFQQIDMVNHNIEIFPSLRSIVVIEVTKNNDFFNLSFPWISNDEQVMIEENINIKKNEVTVQVIMTSNKLGIHHGLKETNYLPVYRFIFSQDGIQYKIDMETDTTESYYCLDEKDIHDDELNSYIKFLRKIVNF